MCGVFRSSQGNQKHTVERMAGTVPPSAAVRIRREGQARDSINSRAWDFFHATPPTQIASKQVAQTPAYMDMAPISARTNVVQYREQPQYMPDPPTVRMGAGAGAAVPRPPPAAFYANPYTQRLDATGFDARNMLRELRGAVVEDNREVDLLTNRRLTQRFYTGGVGARGAVPPALAADLASLSPWTTHHAAP